MLYWQTSMLSVLLDTTAGGEVKMLHEEIPEGP